MDNVKVDEPREAVPDWAGSPSNMAPPGAPGGMSGEKITPPQRSYLIDLINRKVPENLRYSGKLDLIWKCLRISEDPEEFGMSKDKASELITYFQKFNDLPAEQLAAERQQAQMTSEGTDIPDGYYALRGIEGHKNEISFFRLNTGRKGTRWEGFQFIDQVVGHGKRYPQRGTDVRKKIYDAIRQQGVLAAGQLYGQEIGQCARCNRELTDDTSRARGYGPDCWGILGY